MHPVTLSQSQSSWGWRAMSEFAFQPSHQWAVIFVSTDFNESYRLLALSPYCGAHTDFPSVTLHMEEKNCTNRHPKIKGTTTKWSLSPWPWLEGGEQSFEERREGSAQMISRTILATNDKNLSQNGLTKKKGEKKHMDSFNRKSAWIQWLWQCDLHPLNLFCFDLILSRLLPTWWKRWPPAVPGICHSRVQLQQKRKKKCHLSQSSNQVPGLWVS